MRGPAPVVPPALKGLSGIGAAPVAGVVSGGNIDPGGPGAIMEVRVP